MLFLDMFEWCFIREPFIAGVAFAISRWTSLAWCILFSLGWYTCLYIYYIYIYTYIHCVLIPVSSKGCCLNPNGCFFFSGPPPIIHAASLGRSGYIMKIIYFFSVKNMPSGRLSVYIYIYILCFVKNNKKIHEKCHWYNSSSFSSASLPKKYYPYYPKKN